MVLILTVGDWVMGAFDGALEVGFDDTGAFEGVLEGVEVVGNMVG
jgi:hypothetical protein